MALLSLFVTCLLRPPAAVHGFAARIPGSLTRTAAALTTTASSSSSSSLSMVSNKKNTFNPFRMVGDVASNLLNGGDDGTAATQTAAVDEAVMSALMTGDGEDDHLTWDRIREELEARMETDDERHFRRNLVRGYGVGSPLHRVRLYDESNREEDIRVVFYRDSAGWCPYCQKVWLTLEEKKIPYRVEKINMNCYGDKSAEFRRLQPSGQIPVAVIDGRVHRQSDDILRALEESFPRHKSLQPPSDQRARADGLLRLERRLFSAWLSWLTGSPRHREDFLTTLREVERALSDDTGGPFFCGADVSRVDFMYAGFLERMAASLLYFKGWRLRVPPERYDDETEFPAVNRWFDAMETLPSYRLTKSDYFTHCWDLPPQLGGCTHEDAGRPYEKAINGEASVEDPRRSSWSLPLEAHGGGGVEPDWTWAQDGASREAVERVSANHDAVISFAARGAGKPGLPPVAAPLADPRAVPDATVRVSVDACLRVVVMALLSESTAAYDEKMRRVASAVVSTESGGGVAFGRAVVDSLAYLRDRIGVPRDMKLPAARLLRAHLNWAIDHLRLQMQ